MNLSPWLNITRPKKETEIMRFKKTSLVISIVAVVFVTGIQNSVKADAISVWNPNGITAATKADDDPCDNSTLNGRYAFRSEASPTVGGRRLNLALLEFHGDGTYSNLGFTAITDGVVLTGTLAARYEINADCSGRLLNPDGSVQGPIIVLGDGSEFYFLRTEPATLMLTGTGTKVHKH
jgi:hypothetical protein